MRIIAGTYGGRPISAPKGTVTRPTSDRVREALFSRIEAVGGGVSGVSVLDAYAGTGAMGLEALSRGAQHVTFIEQDRRALEVLRTNIDSLDAEAATSLIAGNAGRVAASRTLPGEPYGLMILDPPYRIENAEVREVIDSLRMREVLDSGCLLVWEHDSHNDVAPGTTWTSLGSKVYGSTTVTIFKMHTET